MLTSDHVVLTENMLVLDCSVRSSAFLLNQCFERKENQYSQFAKLRQKNDPYERQIDEFKFL